MPIEDPSSRAERLAARAEAHVLSEFLAMVATIQSAHTLAQLEDLLMAGRFQEAFEAVALASPRLGSAWGVSYGDAARRTSRWMSSNVGGVFFEFDAVNHLALREVQDQSLRLVTGFTRIQEEATRDALVEGMRAGANPRAQARAFRDSIGLTPTQRRAVASYRRALEGLDRNALRRELRDRRFDTTVDRAIRTGTPLDPARIDAMVERYRLRHVKSRAETIARTEGLGAAHRGLAEGYRQAIAAGQLDPNQLVRIWNVAGDHRMRDWHASMAGQERGLLDPFVSGRGNSAMHPGGFGVGSEDINCRCALSMRILSLDELLAGQQVSLAVFA